MADNKVRVQKIDWKSLCIEADRSVEEETEPTYKFNNGRKFTKPIRRS